MRGFCGLLLIVSIAGCGARSEVALDKAQAKIDSLLGKMEVQRKEIEHGMKALDQAITGVKKAKIKAQVQADQLDRKAQPAKDRIAQADATLKRLRPLLASEQTAEIAGKSYSPDELKDMAGKVLKARKDAVAEVEKFDQSREMLTKVVTNLERKLAEYQTTKSRLESQLAEIDANALALKSMQEASAAMGDSDATFEANLASLEDKIAGLSADVQVELAVEDEKWQEGELAKIDDVEKFISDTQETTDPLAEIDALLGPAE